MKKIVKDIMERINVKHHVPMNMIRSAIKTYDPSVVYPVYAALSGSGLANHHNVYAFCVTHCTSKKMKDKVIAMINGESNKHFILRNRCNVKSRTGIDIALGMLRDLYKNGLNKYSKVPMMGHTHLYFCSPIYGHSDYNKVMACTIKGNEKFCNDVISLGGKIMKLLQSKATA